MPDEVKSLTPPYLSYRTLRAYLESLRSSGVPSRIDRSVLRNRSGAEQSMILNALQYLGLIGAEGTPTDALHSLLNADGADRQKRLRDVLAASYAFLFNNGTDLQKAVPSQLQAAFSETGLTGDTMRKAVVFFLLAAQDAEIPVSPYLKVRRGASRRRQQRGGNSVAPTYETPVTPATEPVASVQPGTQLKAIYQTLIDILDPEGMTPEEQEAVWTLIRYVKRQRGA